MWCGRSVVLLGIGLVHVRAWARETRSDWPRKRRKSDSFFILVDRKKIMCVRGVSTSTIKIFV